MRTERKKTAAVLLAALLALPGCGASSSSAYTPAGDIISYKPIDSGKTVITVGKYLAADSDSLEAALEAKFPDVDFVFTEPDAGDNDIAYMKMMSDNGKLEDIQLCSHVLNSENDFLCDLSGEEFTGKYNLSSLDSVSVGGKLYQIPVSNTVVGLAYNKTLFAQHGWKIPETLDDFYALCEAIQTAGIRAFAPCLKYFTVIESTAFGLSYDQVFASAAHQVEYQEFRSKTNSCRGVLEPAFQVMKDLYDKGYVTADDFGASATELRHDLYDGKVAMVPTNLSIAAFVETEKPESEIGFIGFPTAQPGQRWMHMVPGSMLSVSASAMADGAKKQIIDDVLNYFATADGQDALLKCISGVSSLTGYQQTDADLPGEVKDCLESGRMFFADYYASNAFVPTWQSYMSGEMTLEDFIKANDESRPTDYLAALSEKPIGRAADDFTVLDTSIYNADVMRENTGADAALILNGYFYTGNLARIFKGNITLPNRFVLKSVGAKNYLTVYGVTGANLKKLMEHPTVNGESVNAMYACSGLKMKYAPWAGEDANVESLTLSDGSAIDDAATYTVAAWAGSIDAGYISGTVKEYPEVGANKDMMTKAISAAGTIAPAHDGRITLDWSARAK